jgi:hypothetical protein
MEANAYNAMMHSGVKGQRWGRRRYQNPDGSLTPLGRLHYGKLKRKQAKEATQQYKVYSTHERRNASHYSDDELNEFKRRADLEKNFYDSENNLRTARSKYVSAYQHPAKKIAMQAVKTMGNALLNDVAKPYAVHQIKKAINKSAGEQVFDIKSGGGNNNNNENNENNKKKKK